MTARKLTGDCPICFVSSGQCNHTALQKRDVRNPMAKPLQTKEERGITSGRAFSYARKLMLDTKAAGLAVWDAPFSHIDAETIAQRAWADGYVARIRDERKEKQS